MGLYKKTRKAAHGSLTVEAALVLPIFIYAIVAFIYFLQIIYIQEVLQNAITETGFFSAKYAYVYDYILNYEGDGQAADEDSENNSKEGSKDSTESSVNNIDKEASDSDSNYNEDSSQEKRNSAEAIIAHSIDSTYYKIKMQDYLDTDMINESCIENGYNGIYTYLSSYMTEEDAVDIILYYRIKLPVLFLNLQEIPMMQRIRMRGWTGYKVDPKNSDNPGSNTSGTGESDDEIVYITETGSVYHLSKSCSYLNLSIEQVNYDEIESFRNDGGGKYKPCELCGSSGDPSKSNTVYITDSGDRYHWDLNCSGLKRTIIEILLSEVEDRTLCSRCKGK